MLELFSKHRKFFVTGIVVFSSLMFLLVFQENKNISAVFQGFVVGIACLLLIPMFYSKIVLEEPLSDLGLKSGRFLSGILSIIFVLPIACGIEIALTLWFPVFHEQYIFSRLIQTNFLWFLFYELVLSSALLFLYEIFFRGLVQMLWLKALGFWSVGLQAILFYVFFLLKEDFSWQKVPILIFAPFAGYVAYRSKSLWYSFGASWIFIFLTDVFFLTYY